MKAFPGALAQKASMNPNFKDMIRQATLLTRAGRLGEATAAIQRALRGEVPPDAAAPPAKRLEEGRVFDMEPIQARDEAPVDEFPASVPAPAVEPAPARTTPSADGPGVFLKGRHGEAGASRNYRLFVPPGHFDHPPALVVMLHGCTQDPEDFARGTAMNRHALEQGFFVLYPEQSKKANPMRCWNWFKTSDQARGKGEAALLTGMVEAVVREHQLDRRSVYVAGLSAGGAMAAILAHAYPDVYAAAGVHSGLAPGAAGNVMAAMSVMRSGQSSAVAMPPRGSEGPVVPVIAFQGDADSTVNPRNGEQLLDALLRQAVAEKALSDAQTQAPEVSAGQSPGGQRFTRSEYRDAKGRVIAEYWELHGAGHAWAGGSPDGSYTDPQGPDASAAMLRFFFAHRLGEQAEASPGGH
jgi:poly(hydroxyalkanoate) depolymerase family esterase